MGYSNIWYESDDGSGSLNNIWYDEYIYVTSNIWYVSDSGSDDNDCHSASAPCRNLQTVLDRATDGADIYVTSDTLSLNLVLKPYGEPEVCVINSSLSYTVRSFHKKTISFGCPEGMFICWF